MYQKGDKSNTTYNMTLQQEAGKVGAGVEWPGHVLGTPLTVAKITNAGGTPHPLCSYSFVYQVDTMPYQRDFYFAAKYDENLYTNYGDYSGTCQIDAVRCLVNCNGQVNGGPNIGETLNWSDAATWPKVYAANGNTGIQAIPADGDEVVIPSTLAINYDLAMIKNVATGVETVPSGKTWALGFPKLKKLTILGRLQFAEHADITPGSGEIVNTELHAMIIWIRGGQLFIHGGFDETAQDFKAYATSSVQATIVLHGRFGDVALAFSPETEGGNKIIVNNGNFTVVGTALTTRMRGRLYESYMSTATAPFKVKLSKDQLDLGGSATDTLGWGLAVGMNITIAGTDLKDAQTEEFKVMAVDTSNAAYDEVTVDRAPSFDHIGGPASMLTAPCGNLPTRKPDFRAEVTTWAKNVKIVGSNQEAIYSPLAPYHMVTDTNTDWGCTMVHSNYREADVTDPTNLAKSTFYFSESLMKNVQMYNCTQRDTLKGFVRYEGLQLNSAVLPAPAAERYNHRLEDCGMSDGLSWGLYIKNATRVYIKRNILSRVRVRGVVISESTDVSLEDNVIQAIWQRPKPPGSDVSDIVAGLHVSATKATVNPPTDKCYNLKITGNIIHDSFDYCAIVPGMMGTAVPSAFTVGTFSPTGNKIIMDNTVHSCFTGWLQIADHSWNTSPTYQKTMMFVKGITAYRVNNLALASIAEIWNQRFEEAISFDSVRHVSINNYQADLDASGLTTSLLNSCLVGKHIGTVISSNDPCPYTCPAGGDLFACQFNYGFVTSGFSKFEAKKVWPPPMPAYHILWWKGKEVPLRDGQFKGTGNYFVNWYGKNRCNFNLTAMIDNSHQKSKVPTQIFTTTTFHNVENDNLFYLWGYNQTLRDDEREMCGGFMSCTGTLNTLFKFDGSTTSTGLTHSTPIPVLPTGVTRPTSGTF